MQGLPYRQGSIRWSTFDVSRQLAERGEACLVRRLPPHRRGGSQDEVKLAPPYARSLAHAHGGSQDEQKILLVLPPFTPCPYYLGQRDYHIVWNICPLVDFNMNYQYILQTLMYIDVFQSVDSLILLRMQHKVETLILERREYIFAMICQSLRCNSMHVSLLCI